MRLGIYFGIHLDHFSALVEAAVLADSVGNSQCAAVGALAERRSADLPAGDAQGTGKSRTEEHFGKSF